MASIIKIDVSQSLIGNVILDIEGLAFSKKRKGTMSQSLIGNVIHAETRSYNVI